MQFAEGMQEVEALVGRLNALPDARVRADAQRLLQVVLELHRSGLSALVETMDASGEVGRKLLTDAARDPALSSVMLLHDLHPLSLEERVRQALSKVEPYLRSHGGGVTLLEIREGVVHLRLEGTCNGCPSSSATLKLAVEEAVYEHAPDVAGFAVEGQPAPTGDVLVSLGRGPREEPALDAWVDLPQVPHADGACCNIEVRGRSVLVCRVGEQLFAYAAVCPSCSAELATTSLADGRLVCDSCQSRFAVVRAGMSESDPSLHLDPLPLLQDRGMPRVALAAPSAPA